MPDDVKYVALPTLRRRFPGLPVTVARSLEDLVGGFPLLVDPQWVRQQVEVPAGPRQALLGEREEVAQVETVQREPLSVAHHLRAARLEVGTMQQF